MRLSPVGRCVCRACTARCHTHTRVARAGDVCMYRNGPSTSGPSGRGARFLCAPALCAHATNITAFPSSHSAWPLLFCGAALAPPRRPPSRRLRLAIPWRFYTWYPVWVGQRGFDREGWPPPLLRDPSFCWPSQLAARRAARSSPRRASSPRIPKPRTRNEKPPSKPSSWERKLLQRLRRRLRCCPLSARKQRSSRCKPQWRR